MRDAETMTTRLRREAESHDTEPESEALLSEHASYYAALRSRDARFDGRFFTAVLTTGIYCRPVCPARPPKRENVRFFACAAAAEEAGFRACRRCRPETAPGTPAWAGSSATVARALRLIEDGAADQAGLDELASRLGVTDRHLRRLFNEHLGASPISVARVRRIHLARQLIDGTDLPMTRIAMASGFLSLRNFNDAIRASFGAPPSQLRAARRQRLIEGGPLRLRLGYRPPFDWDGMLRFFSARAIPGVERVGGGVYQRVLRFGEVPGVVEIRHDAQRAQLEVAVPLAGVEFASAIVASVRRDRKSVV